MFFAYIYAITQVRVIQDLPLALINNLFQDVYYNQGGKLAHKGGTLNSWVHLVTRVEHFKI